MRRLPTPIRGFTRWRETAFTGLQADHVQQLSQFGRVFGVVRDGADGPVPLPTIRLIEGVLDVHYGPFDNSPEHDRTDPGITAIVCRWFKVTCPRDFRHSDQGQ